MTVIGGEIVERMFPGIGSSKARRSGGPQHEL